MDDTVQPNSQPNSNVVITPQEPQAAPSMKPEHEPLGAFVRPSEPEPNISQELTEQGVTTVNQHVPNLPQEVRNAGVVHAKETNTPNLNPSFNLPLTKAQAQQGKKSGVGNSLAWLSALILKVLRA